LFFITCTTCRARLAVRNTDVIGAILACPQCGSMVEAVPPDGWKPEGSESKRKLVEDPPKKESLTEEQLQPALESPSPTPATAEPAAEQPPEPSSAGTVAAAAAASTAADGPDSRDVLRDISSRISGDEVVADDTVVSEETISPIRPGASAAELRWRKWLIWGSVPVVALVVIVGFTSLFSSRRAPEFPPESLVEKPTVPDDAAGPAKSPAAPQIVADAFQRRWLPDGTSLFFSVGVVKLAQQPNASEMMDPSNPWWQQTIGPLVRSLDLKIEDIERLTWASTDLSRWTQQNVVILEFSEDYNTESLVSLGKPAGVSLDGHASRFLADAAWPHPFAVVDKRTVVTGDIELLRHLAQRKEADFESPALKRMLASVAPGADATLLLDLAAARAAGWKVPVTLFDIWPLGKQPWHELCEIPQGIGCTFRYASPLHVKVALVCDSDTAADKVNTAMSALIPAAQQALTTQLDLVGEKLRAGELGAAAAGQYELFLDEALTATNGVRWEAAGDTVSVRGDFTKGPTELAALTIDNRSAIAADWLAAALIADKARLDYLMAGLMAFQKAEGRFPEGAKGSSLLAPETRLSWIANLLPYYGHSEWSRDLQTGYSWNSSQNRPVTEKPLPEVINPALGPAKTRAGFPVTHYVGVAGVGANAGRLKSGDPKAGVFGYGRTTRPEDIADGASNTVALLGVTRKVGAWAAGGNATVRPLTKTPYVNGPDGFGSGQPNGMFAGMADGSVRFLSKDMDPRVLEMIVTANGHEPQLAVNVRPPVPGPVQPPAQPAARPADPVPGPDVPVAVEAPAPATPPGPPAAPTARQIDVRAQLAEKIPVFDLQGVPLIKAVELLTALSTVPISLDPEAIQQLGITPRDPVRMKMSDATLGEILEALAASRGLLPVIENGQVLLTTPRPLRETLQPVRYTVSDLTHRDKVAMDRLAGMVQTLVAPETWQAGGGRGTLRTDDTSLIVTQTGPVHSQVVVFCEKLRSARGLPLRSRGGHERFKLTTRRGQALPILRRPVTVNFYDPTPLAEILAYLGEHGGVTLLIDRAALHAAGLNSKSLATVSVEKQPLDLALEKLLRPLGLVYRVVDARTLQITTYKADIGRLELEFYPVERLLPDGTSASDLIERIKGRVAGSTWSDAGGPGVIHFDKRSKCLMVLQSQPVQVAVERLLAQKPANGS